MNEKKAGSEINENYLDTAELCQRIKYKPGSINNLVTKGVLIEGIHFIKPTRKKRLFLWSRMETWLHRRSPNLPDEYDDQAA